MHIKKNHTHFFILLKVLCDSSYMSQQACFGILYRWVSARVTGVSLSCTNSSIFLLLGWSCFLTQQSIMVLTEVGILVHYNSCPQTCRNSWTVTRISISDHNKACFCLWLIKIRGNERIWSYVTSFAIGQQNFSSLNSSLLAISHRYVTSLID